MFFLALPRIKTIIIVGLSISALQSPAQSGIFFGPKKSDLEKITISRTEMKCAGDNFYSFKIENNSKYKLLMVSFSVFGEIEGRSTRYTLDGTITGVKDDIITMPGKDHNACALLNLSEAPTGGKLIMKPHIWGADFEDDGKAVSVAP